MDVQVQQAHFGLNKCEMLIPGFYYWDVHQLEAAAPCSHISSSQDLRQDWEPT